MTARRYIAWMAGTVLALAALAIALAVIGKPQPVSSLADQQWD